MNKKTLYLIISLMTISLVGIIWVQVYWIHHSIRIKQAQFDQLVTNSLNHTIDLIQDDESINFIHSQLAHVDDSTKHISKHIKNWQSKKNTGDSVDLERAFNYEITSEGDGEDVKMTISINGEEQLLELEEKMEKMEAILNDSLLKIDGKHFEFSNRFGNIIIKMAKEFESIDQPIQHLLEQTNLYENLESSLKDNGIDIPFTYGVIKDDELVTEFSSKGFDLDDADYSVRLFKNNILDNSAMLALHFNGKHNYVFQSMWLMLLCSLIFTLVILFTFGTTLHYMYKQKKLSEMKSDFINNMTHEFKTPISTISLAIDSITHPKIIDNHNQINHFADVIRKENERMNRQIESVLNTALGEKGELDLERKQLGINALLAKIPERMKLQLDHKQANLNLNLSEKELNILGDEMHLQNALCNLIDNSLKYTKNKPIINISTAEANGYAQIDVTDNGIGMSMDTQKKVFEKFYREERGNIHTVKGFGIGLSYVKAIVEGHCGVIRLSSKENAGTTISLFIPLVK